MWRAKHLAYSGVADVEREGYILHSQAGLNVVLKMGQTSVLVRDALRRPLAELELGALEAGLRRIDGGVMQAYLGIHISAWSFNPVIPAWEPILESWNLIIKLDANSSAAVRPHQLSHSLPPLT